MQIRKLSGSLGAEISGLDLARGVSREQAAALRGAFNEHLVIFLREQDLSPQQFLDFANATGEPIEYSFVKGIEGYPTIIEVKKLETERVNFCGIWFSDTTYLEVPPMGSMLLSREIPPYGGDTDLPVFLRPLRSSNNGLG
ncbi:TauD/TfdA dioxygenase family protein [Caballeronia sp. HLA56]